MQGIWWERCQLAARKKINHLQMCLCMNFPMIKRGKNPATLQDVGKHPLECDGRWLQSPKSPIPRRHIPSFPNTQADRMCPESCKCEGVVAVLCKLYRGLQSSSSSHVAQTQLTWLTIVVLYLCEVLTTKGFRSQIHEAFPGEKNPFFLSYVLLSKLLRLQLWPS